MLLDWSPLLINPLIRQVLNRPKSNQLHSSPLHVPPLRPRREEGGGASTDQSRTPNVYIYKQLELELITRGRKRENVVVTPLITAANYQSDNQISIYYKNGGNPQMKSSFNSNVGCIRWTAECNIYHRVSRAVSLLGPARYH